jgi:hypothetical protein
MPALRRLADGWYLIQGGRNPGHGSQKSLVKGRTDRCLDCKQSCPCRRTSGGREPRRGFAFGLSFARFEIRFHLSRRVSNAIVCHFKRRISSIRRSSLSSTTLRLISSTLPTHGHCFCFPVREVRLRVATDICLARACLSVSGSLNASAGEGLSDILK